VEADAKAIGNLTGGLKQRAASARSTPNLDARLSSEYSLETRRRTQSDRSAAALPSIAGRLDDLFQLLDGVEAEGAHAVDVIGLGIAARA
jgi:hypothetical protein